MNEHTSEALRAWFKQLEGIYPELFNTAHVICGNYDQAEYALRSAILEVWAENAESGMGFREKLRGAVRAEAFQALEEAGDSPAEYTWPGFPQDSDDALIRQAAREAPEVQRMLMLKHGAGLSVKRIAQLTNTAPGYVRTTLERFEARSRRALPAQERGRFDAHFGRAAKRVLASRVGIPHPSTVYRSFEAEASTLTVSEHRVSRIIYRLVVLLMAVICAVMFWLFAVLVQRPAVEGQPDDAPVPAATVETTYQVDGQG